MSYTRTNDAIDKAIKQTKDSPCEAAYLRLMRGIASGWTPLSEVSDMVINEYNQRLEQVKPSDKEKFCEALGRTPLTLITSVNAFTIGQAAHHFGHAKANDDVALSMDFFNNYSKSLTACKATLFYRNNSGRIDRSIQVAKEKRDNLKEFQDLHRKCIK